MQISFILIALIICLSAYGKRVNYIISLKEDADKQAIAKDIQAAGGKIVTDFSILI
jgi:hypothetical protein